MPRRFVCLAIAAVCVGCSSPSVEPEPDAGLAIDGGGRIDGGSRDAAIDARTDVDGGSDAGGEPDAGDVDGGDVDAGGDDAGVGESDAGSHCGDRVVEGGEQCDDGNTLDDDGCAACRYAEMRVNAGTTGDQREPSVGVTRDGRAVIAYTGLDGDGAGVLVRTYSATGVPGTEIQVNTFVTGNQSAPCVLLREDGSFVVVWLSDGQDGSGGGIYSRPFDPSGAAIAGEQRVNVATTGDQGRPVIAAGLAGGYHVAFDSPGPTGRQILLDSFDAAGARTAAGERSVSTSTGDQTRPAIASSPAGELVVTWTSAMASSGPDTEGTAVRARSYDASGAPIGGEVVVNVATRSDQSGSCVVASDPRAGSPSTFLHAWESALEDGVGLGVVARRITPPSTGVGGAAVVDLDTIGDQLDPTCASTGLGRDWIVWTGGTAPHLADVRGRSYTGGVASTTEEAISTFATGRQSQPSAAASERAMLVAWTSGGQDGSGDGVFARWVE